MKIGKLKKEIGKWQFCFDTGLRNYDVFGIRPYIRFFFIKFVSIPLPGDVISKENYTGFIFAVRVVWDECVVREKMFRLPMVMILNVQRDYMKKNTLVEYGRIFDPILGRTGLFLKIHKKVFVLTESRKIHRIVYPIKIKNILKFGL
jgi:hypothetical protein